MTRDLLVLWTGSPTTGEYVQVGRTKTPAPPPPPPPSGARFPGDTPDNSHWVLGLDEGDGDPKKIKVGERMAPEVDAQTPIGGMRAYYSVASDASSILATTGGNENSNIRQRILTHYSKGRMTWASIAFGNLSDASDGRNNTEYYSWITWAEEAAEAPVPKWFTINHEVDDPQLPSSTVTAWGAACKNFRKQMDLYADAHGGVGVYKWKNLAFTFILTASGYARGSQQGAVNPLWQAAAYTTGVSATASNDTLTATGHQFTNGCRVRLLSAAGGLSGGTDYFVISATTNTLKLSTTRGGSAANVTSDATGITLVYHDVFDFAGVDSYQFPVSGETTVGRQGIPDHPIWQANFIKTVAWVTDPAHKYALAIGEWGVHYNDKDAGDNLNLFVNKVLDGTHDIIAGYYFNSHGNGTRDPAMWCLWDQRDDGLGNTQLGTKFVAWMKNAKCLNFWELDSPEPTHTYVKPPGV